MADYAVSRNTVNTVKDSRQHIRKGKGLYDLDARVLHTATASAAAISSRGESGVGFDLLLCGTGVAYLRTAVDGRVHAKYDTGEIGSIKMGSGDTLLLALGDLGRDYAEDLDTGDDAGPLTHEKFTALLADDDAIADDIASAVADHGGGPVNLILLRVR